MIINTLCAKPCCTLLFSCTLQAVDFIGISSYPRYKGKLTDMEDSTEMFAQELQVCDGTA